MKKNMILFGIIILLIPLFVVSFKNKANFLNEEEYDTNTADNIIIKVKDTKTNNISEINLEEYVIGVVAGEMPASFNIEALKAQSIASRTYVISRMKDNTYDVTNDTSSQVYLTKEQMQEKWGIEYEKWYQVIENAVNSTEGIIMKYNGIPITAYYFAISNGNTESAINVFKEEIPYLVSVPSNDTNVNKYEVTTYFSKDDFKKTLGIESTDIIITDIKKDATNHVESITINSKLFSGIEVRKLLNLRSTDFVINVGDEISITTYGYGHGVGMSQYGANEMAKSGSTYEEILNHYYQNISIEKI